MLKKIGHLGLYLIYVFVVFEIFARLVYTVPYTSNRLVGREEASWKNRWIDRHSEENEIYYKFDLFDETKGWRIKPNIKNEVVFDNKFLNTNSKGLRGIKEFSYKKDPDKTRIVLIGDSFTFGDEVSDDETFGHYLQEQFPDIEVLNMGVHGYGHDQILIYLKEEGIKYQPDIVILGFIKTDMERNLLSFRDYAKPYFKLKSGELELHNSPVPTPQQTLRWNWTRLRMYDLFDFTRYRLWKGRPKYFEKQKEIATPILSEIVNTINSIGAKAVFAYLPHEKEIISEESVLEGEKYLQDFCNEKGKVHYFTARPKFKRLHDEGVDVGLVGHWPSAGHQAVASVIAQQLSALKLISN